MKISAYVISGLLALAPMMARADAEADWKQIEAMDNSAPPGNWKTREEAEAGTVAYLNQQEQTLRMFIHAYPDDVHTPDVKLRLAHLLATRADIRQNPLERHAAEAILDELEAEPAMKDRRADVEFARISIFMQRVDAVSGANRDELLVRARGYAKAFPDDRRVAALLAEVASAYEDEPRVARALLEEAQPKATTPEIQARIADDLKRLAMLGKPVEMHWTAVDGTQIDLQNLRGKVVLIYFFASWSAPSMAELDWVRQLGAGSESIQTLGICLDHDPVAVPGMMADHTITWPVYCDGQGWQGKLARGLGVNELPMLWVVDRDGNLLTLNAKQDAARLISHALNER